MYDDRTVIAWTARSLNCIPDPPAPHCPSPVLNLRAGVSAQLAVTGVSSQQRCRTDRMARAPLPGSVRSHVAVSLRSGTGIVNRTCAQPLAALHAICPDGYRRSWVCRTAKARLAVRGGDVSRT